MKKIIYFLFLAILFSSCGFTKMLPNKDRDQYYMDHTDKIDYELLKKVYEGNTKEDALKEWGEPWEKKSEDIWIYKFPFLKNKIVLVFKNDVVISRYGTMW